MRIRKQRLLQLCAVVFTPLLMITMLAKPSFATAVVTPNSVYDDFEEMLFKPDPDAYWWVSHWGSENDAPATWFDQACGNATCVLEGVDNGIDYLDFVLYDEAEEGYYNNVDVAELQSGFAYGQEGVWHPSYRDPVVVEARVRWVGDFHKNGSGDAVGTSGIWLWNSPIDIPNNEFHPVTSMGISWSTDGAIFGKGLAGTVLRNDIPVNITKPLFDVDMNEWTTLKFEWGRNLLGTQYVKFWINDRFIGCEWLQLPITQSLSLEMWHDNQTYKLLGPELPSPVEDQHFQVDYVNVYID